MVTKASPGHQKLLTNGLKCGVQMVSTLDITDAWNGARKIVELKPRKYSCRRQGEHQSAVVREEWW